MTFRNINIAFVLSCCGKTVSVVSAFTSGNVKDWLQQETKSLFVPIHQKAEKLYEEMNKALKSLNDVSRMLLDNSQKEIEKRNMKTYGRARALNKLARLFLDRLKQVKPVDEVTHDTFGDYTQEVQRVFAVIETDMRNYFPRISPYFILDRRKFQAIFERSKMTLEDLNNFLTKEYVKAKTLEETFQLIDRVQSSEQQLVNLKNQKSTIENDCRDVVAEIGRLQERTVELRSKGELSQLTQMGAEIGALNVEVKHQLQHIQKPFVKLQSLATHGEGSGLTPEELSKLNQYVTDPFEAFATEQPGHPLLKQILRKLDRAMSEDKLKLKAEKVRKAEQVIECILEKDALTALHQKSVTATARRKQLASSSEVAETELALSRLKGQLDELERKKRILDGELNALNRSTAETSERIKSHKSEIEKNVFSFAAKRIHIQ